MTGKLKKEIDGLKRMQKREKEYYNNNELLNYVNGITATEALNRLNNAEYVQRERITYGRINEQGMFVANDFAANDVVQLRRGAEEILFGNIDNPIEVPEIRTVFLDEVGDNTPNVEAWNNVGGMWTRRLG